MLAKRWLSALLCALVLVILPIFASTSYAHAVIANSEPAANAQLGEAPAEIRIWFTEPLEPTYSTIQVRDSMGVLVDAPPSQVDAADDHQLALTLGELPEGVYTVVWRNVSSADGHQSAGSFPFSIGAASATTAVASVTSVNLKPFDLLARWVNFWALAVAIGSIAFIVFVWQPATRSFPGSFARGTPQALWVVVWIGWLVAGIGGSLLLVNQTAILLNEAPGNVLVLGKLVDVINSTRFGLLWLMRMGLWVVMGLLLLAARRSGMVAWLATACGLLMLLPVSLHSHAAVSNDVALSVFSDWVHLAMTSLWVGGLVQFLVAIPVVARLARPVAPKLGQMVAHFSNFARAAVVGLIVTGVYATWHQVNTVEALTTTFYGQLLSIKLVLALLLVAIAGVNLLWTQRRLLAGQAVWVGRLRGLVAIEVGLAFAILLAVGAMTAVNPARNEIMQRELAAVVPFAPEPQPVHLSQSIDDLTIHFTAMPGWVGNSTFTVQLVGEDEAPIPNASLIRLRFKHQTEDLGESELQIRPDAEVPDGVYFIDGANLSTVGEWRVRMTIQRPEQFDSVVDFTFNVIAPPAPPPAPTVDLDAVPPYRTVTFLAVGALALLAGVAFLAAQRFRAWQGAGLLALVLVVLGITFIVSGLMT